MLSYAVNTVSDLIEHVNITPLHSTLFPYMRFPVTHAARVTLVWAGMTKGRKQVPLLQDMFGYLVLAWGGGTITSFLLSQPPSWLVDPTPWLIYPSAYLLLIQSGLASYAISTVPTLINTFGTLVDGMTRGTTITALPRLLAKSDGGLDANMWSTAILSGVAVSSGGWVVQGLGLAESEWKVSRPNIMSGGLFDTLDMTSGAFIGLLYASLTRSLPQLEQASDLVMGFLPGDLVSTLAKGEGKGKDVVDTRTARAVCVMVLASTLLARVVVKLFQANVSGQIIRKTQYNVTETGSEEKTEIVKKPIQVHPGTPKATPRNNKATSP